MGASKLINTEKQPLKYVRLGLQWQRSFRWRFDWRDIGYMSKIVAEQVLV